MKGLESNTKFGQIMTEAVHRMQHYTKSNVSPLEQPTWYIENTNDMWMLELKAWMDRKKFTIKTDRKKKQEGNCEKYQMIMDVITRVTLKKEAWKWINETGLEKLSDLTDSNGEEREELQEMRKIPGTYRTIYNEVAGEMRKLGNWNKNIVNRKYIRGTQIKNGNTSSMHKVGTYVKPEFKIVIVQKIENGKKKQ